MFTDKNGNGVVDVTNTASNEILQENHFYPFGLDMAGPWMNDAALDNQYKYNGKELNGDFGLNWMDYGARWYDGVLGRWGCVDPLAEKYFNLSGYVYVDNNPISQIDPFGMEIVNGHKDERDNAQRRLSEAQKNLESFSGDNKSREYKKLQKELKRAESAFNSANEKYQIVESAIADLKENNSEEYDALNDLKDAGGNAVDVYISTKDNLVDDRTGQKVDGITEVNPNNAILLIDNSTKERKLLLTVKSQFGENTVSIVLNKASETIGATLAHEGGHAIYEVQNLAEYIEWLKRHPDSRTGHESTNPSGQRAYKEEGIYYQNKKQKK